MEEEVIRSDDEDCVLFEQEDKAEEGNDIFDCNELFLDTGVR